MKFLVLAVAAALTAQNDIPHKGDKMTVASLDAQVMTAVDQERQLNLDDGAKSVIVLVAKNPKALAPQDKVYAIAGRVAVLCSAASIRVLSVYDLDSHGEVIEAEKPTGDTTYFVPKEGSIGAAVLKVACSPQQPLNTGAPHANVVEL